ncbi:hypothetical protein [Roseobacter sp. CCS2]|uniref:hypothetical protein n=1 Tax=Roseobacter sp. CCS2 TaxID=391593 RepID=UPI0000F3C629|nr:hypothetical protein [Roseobacter sp. CCS2]EBA11722.1 hypothetical protein RCCS2_17376 [Roseobacter sp. CCS2]
MKKFWVILGALIVAGVSAYAGGLADAITETVPVMADPVEAESSVPAWVIPAAIIAVLIGVAVLADDDDDDDGSEPT